MTEYRKTDNSKRRRHCASEKCSKKHLQKRHLGQGWANRIRIRFRIRFLQESTGIDRNRQNKGSILSIPTRIDKDSTKQVCVSSAHTSLYLLLHVGALHTRACAIVNSQYGRVIGWSLSLAVSFSFSWMPVDRIRLERGQSCDAV